MSVIQKIIILEGNKKTESAEAIFDSGATYSCIQAELAERLETLIKLPRPLLLGTAKNGDRVNVSRRVMLNFFLDDLMFTDEFMVIPELSAPVLIGDATLQKWRMKLDFEHDQVILDPKVTRLWLL